MEKKHDFTGAKLLVRLMDIFLFPGLLMFNVANFLLNWGVFTGVLGLIQKRARQPGTDLKIYLRRQTQLRKEYKEYLRNHNDDYRKADLWGKNAYGEYRARQKALLLVHIGAAFLPGNLVPLEIREFLRENPHSSLSGYKFLWSPDVYQYIKNTFLPSPEE